MRVLELFSGSATFSRIATERGHEAKTLDYDKKLNATYCMDIEEFKPELMGSWRPDIIWASPDCRYFSVASLKHYWEKGKPKNEKTLKGIRNVEKTLEIISSIGPRFFFIENPRAMMRKLTILSPLFFLGVRRCTITYCAYGMRYQKPTDIWTNSYWKPRPACNPGDSCHESAPRGTKNGGIQGLRSKKDRGKIPEQLAIEILEYCERSAK